MGIKVLYPSGVHIGIGEQPEIDSLRVTWPDGLVQVMKNPPIDTILKIQYQTTNLAASEKRQKRATYFSKIQSNIQLLNKENDYDDYKEQVLLPHKMSQFGPAIAVGDINGNGMDDLYFGQSTGEISRLYTQRKNGSFKETQAFENDAAYEDVDASFLDMDNDKDLDLYVASGETNSNQMIHFTAIGFMKI